MTKSNERTNPGKLARLEKVPAAASRMGISISGVYREVKAGRLGPLVKLGVRASALTSESVDAWIESRISESRAVSAAASKECS